MSRQYTEQDTERAREAERSSAGLQTQQLSGVSQSVGTKTAQPVPGRNNLAALVLIGLGVLLLLGRAVPFGIDIVPGMILLTIASAFLFFSFWQRSYPLLIPGSILAGLSVGVTFADLTNGVSVLWGLALGFLAILFLGRALFKVNSPWPVFPAVPLFAVGVIVAISSLPGLFAGALVWLPLLLIGAGLYLSWGRTR